MTPEEPQPGSSSETDKRPTAPAAPPPLASQPPTNQAAKLERRAEDPVEPTLSPEEKVRLEKEYDRHIHFYEFYLEYGLKSVAVYYAVVGGILSIYYAASGKMNNAVIGVLLFLSLLMSLALGVTFLWGKTKWKNMAKHIEKLAEELKIVKPPGVELLRPPDVALLNYLLLLFGILFIVTAGALGWLIVQLVASA